MSDSKPFNLTDFQLPPVIDDQKFERLVMQAFNSADSTNSYQLFGRSGQRQHGFDIISREKGTVIQCKLKHPFLRNDKLNRKELIKDLHSDFEQFQVFNSNVLQGKIYRYIFASTYKADTILQKECFKLSTDVINVEYWDWRSLQEILGEREINRYFPGLFESLSRYYTGQELAKPSSKKNKKVGNLIDQLVQFLNSNYRDFSFLPLHVLIKRLPIRSNEGRLPYYSSATISTDNKEFHSLVASVANESGKIDFESIDKRIDKKTARQMKKLFSQLAINLISRFELGNNFSVFEFEQKQHRKCNCELCQWNRFEYDKLFSSLNSSREKTLEQNLKCAYVNYQVGRYFAAYGLLQTAKLQAVKQERHTLVYVIHYNLQKLANFIASTYYADANKLVVVEELKGLDLTEQLNLCKDEGNREVLEWINNDAFFSDAFQRLTTRLREIQSHYENCANGGSGSNWFIQKLLFDYAEIDSFLERNFIFYNRFNEYKELSDLFVESIIASHAIKDKNSSRLIFLNEWIFKKIIVHADPDKLLGYFHKYNLDEVVIQEISRDSVLSIFVKLIQWDGASSNTEVEDSLKHRNTSMVAVALLLLSRQSLPIAKIERVFILISDHYNHDNLLGHVRTKYINEFIKRHLSKLNVTFKRKFLKLIIQKSALHCEEIFKTVAYTIRGSLENSAITNEFCEGLCDVAFGRCKDCKQPHSQRFAFYFFRLLPEQYKVRVRKELEVRLTEEFNADLVYYALIFEVLSPSSPWFEKFRESVSIPKSSEPRFVGPDNRINSNARLNDFINVCYKYNIDLSSDTYNRFRGLNNYYDWLLSIDTFNYDLFDPIWVTLYGTDFYRSTFSKSIELRNRLFKHLEHHRHPAIEEALLRILKCIQ